MPAPPLSRLILIPALLMALAGGLALAQGDGQSPTAPTTASGAPSSESAAAASPGPVQTPASTPDPTTDQPTGQTPQSPAQSQTQPTVAPSASPTPETITPPATAPAEPEKKRHGKKAAPVLDPVGEGKMLFETRCGLCHSVPRPSAHTMTEWPECINRMAARSYLRESDTKLMLQYLEHELKPQDVSEWDGKAG